MSNDNKTPEQIEADRQAYIQSHPDLAPAVRAWADHKRKMKALLEASGKRQIAEK